MGWSQEKISCLFSIWSPPQRENLLSQENISCLFSFWSPPNEKIFCVLSHEKISYLKRKSHVFSVLVSPLTRKSPVTCLMRKSHVSRENLMSYLFGPNPQQENLLSPV